jgi:hypothetical protein
MKIPPLPPDCPRFEKSFIDPEQTVWTTSTVSIILDTLTLIIGVHPQEYGVDTWLELCVNDAYACWMKEAVRIAELPDCAEYSKRYCRFFKNARAKELWKKHDEAEANAALWKQWGEFATNGIRREENRVGTA